MIQRNTTFVLCLCHFLRNMRNFFVRLLVCTSATLARPVNIKFTFKNSHICLARMLARLTAWDRPPVSPAPRPPPPLHPPRSARRPRALVACLHVPSPSASDCPPIHTALLSALGPAGQAAGRALRRRVPQGRPKQKHSFAGRSKIVVGIKRLIGRCDGLITNILE